MSERLRTMLVPAALVLFLLWLPQYAESFWLQTGLFAMSAAIGAIGLTLLVGVTGQLSLAHAFFVAIGAYGYCFLAGGGAAAGASGGPGGAGLPPWLAMIGAVLLAGLAGALFSPIAGRLRGIYLGLASLGLVFIGQHILFNAKDITGGFNGRDAKPFSVFGFTFADTNPDRFVVFGVPYGQLERLWYLGLVLVALAWWFAHNLVCSRPGRAMHTVRDSEVAAAVMGVSVPGYKAAAFTVSSMYAGLAGVFLALAFGRIVPDSFGFLVSIDFLVMIVIGGLGSIGGAVAGGLIVSALPLLLDHYSGSLPLVAEAGGDGLQPSEAARFLYGAAVVAVVIYAPHGLAGLSHRRLQAKEKVP
ncbi:branched-chain amino acid ABC transporter permease [Candidatus Solirubrobacter pratensis]|uniref:branched-chain amino acid ABC transporter permease n=1 Tax=Candidatus Solirubrobacter pratensis TaxID=1298857 RepID=UPI0003FB89F9|nr:branched-chain amino acid ABC transporter permease [Candidatus Solirubrobacter pratensis]